MEERNGRRSRGPSPNGHLSDDSSASDDSDHGEISRFVISAIVADINEYWGLFGYFLVWIWICFSSLSSIRCQMLLDSEHFNGSSVLKIIGVYGREFHELCYFFEMTGRP